MVQSDEEVVGEGGAALLVDTADVDPVDDVDNALVVADEDNDPIEDVPVELPEELIGVLEVDPLGGTVLLD